MLAKSIAVTLAALLSVAQNSNDDREISVQLLDRYCLAWDGDHRATWQRLEEAGFAPVEVDRSRSIIGVLDATLRVYERNQGGTSVRVMTGANWIRMGGQGRTYYRWCWVSAPGDLGRADRQIAAMLGVGSFRVVRGTRLFAWIPRPGEINERVSRNAYFRSGQVLAREQGLRQVTMRSHDGQVYLGYGSPRDEATYLGFDWAGPEPVPRSAD